MNNALNSDRTPSAIEHEAAAWVLRQDRGLDPAEQDAFSEWLAADPRHGQQIARHRDHWERLDQLVQWRPDHSARPNPDLLAPPRRRQVLRVLSLAVSLAAAAAITLLFVLRDLVEIPASGPAQQSVTAASNANQRVLDDGSIVELNRGAEIAVDFTPAERRVSLERGEAHFAVTKDVARPFIVSAGGVDVRAVGTAFNVRVDSDAIEVLVTEGSVRLDGKPGAAAADLIGPLVPMLEARQRAVIAITPAGATPQIATLTAREIERVLAWQHRLLDFTSTPLNAIVAEFNRRNVVQLVVIDPELASIRVSAVLRSDNIDGFVRLLEAGFGTRAERRGETEILLRLAK